MENKPKPTLQAIQMKREQQDIQQKQIIALLDQKRELHEAIHQTDLDLEFIGYHPLEAPQEPRMTESEFHLHFRKSGFAMYNVKEVTKKLHKLERLEKATKKTSKKK